MNEIEHIKEQINSIEDDLIDLEGALFLVQDRIRTHRKKLKLLRSWILKLVENV